MALAGPLANPGYVGVESSSPEHNKKGNIMPKKGIAAATPSAGLPDWEAMKGKLLVVEPLELEKNVKTSVNETPTDAIRANLWAINSKAEVVDEMEYEDTLIFPRVLVSSLKRKMDSYVVGVLGQGEKQKGKNAPWQLEEPNEKHLKVAAEFVAGLSVSGPSGSGDDFEDEPEGEDDGDAF